MLIIYINSQCFILLLKLIFLKISAIRPTWKVPLFPIHRPGEFFFNLTRPGSKFWGKTFLSLKFFLSLSLPVTSFLRKWAIYNKTTTLNLEHTFFYEKLLSIDFLCFRLPVGNLRKINQNQKTSWDCNSCSTHSIYMK